MTRLVQSNMGLLIAFDVDYAVKAIRKSQPGAAARFRLSWIVHRATPRRLAGAHPIVVKSQ